MHIRLARTRLTDFSQFTRRRVRVGLINVCAGFALLADSEADADRERQETDLDRLERWLIAAESALSSLRCKPQHLTTFEEALTLHRVSFFLASLCFICA